MFQLMPPRGGNRCQSLAGRKRNHVSTHAPARGQSGYSETRKSAFLCFNSCPREGAIISSAVCLSRRGKVSTHAPARGQSANLHKAVMRTQPCSVKIDSFLRDLQTIYSERRKKRRRKCFFSAQTRRDSAYDSGLRGFYLQVSQSQPSGFLPQITSS